MGRKLCHIKNFTFKLLISALVALNDFSARELQQSPPSRSLEHSRRFELFAPISITISFLYPVTEKKHDIITEGPKSKRKRKCESPQARPETSEISTSAVKKKRTWQNRIRRSVIKFIKSPNLKMKLIFLKPGCDSELVGTVTAGPGRARVTVTVTRPSHSESTSHRRSPNPRSVRGTPGGCLNHHGHGWTQLINGVPARPPAACARGQP
jgi:hypothetical protein